MAIESYEVHTIKCDIPSCKEKRTSGSVKTLRDEGWHYVEIFDKSFEVCPEHKMDLREFFFDSQ
jgi:hypothetical protein